MSPHFQSNQADLFSTRMEYKDFQKSVMKVMEYWYFRLFHMFPDNWSQVFLLIARKSFDNFPDLEISLQNLKMDFHLYIFYNPKHVLKD